MGPRAHEVLRAVAGACGLAVILVGLHAAGGGEGSPPADPQHVWWWLQGRDPLAASVGLLRLVALAGAWYLAAVSLLTTVVRLSAVRRPAFLVTVATSATVRRAARLVLGGAVVTAMLAPPAVAATGSGGDDPAPPPEVARYASTVTGLPTDVGASPSPVAGPVDEGWVPPGTGQLHERLTAARNAAPDPDAHPAPETAPKGREEAARARVHEVSVGESFWSIAADAVAGEADGDVDDGRVAAYWLALIEENRHRLVDEDDPDLLLPGQLLTLPW